MSARLGVCGWRTGTPKPRSTLPADLPSSETDVCLSLTSADGRPEREGARIVGGSRRKARHSFRRLGRNTSSASDDQFLNLFLITVMFSYTLGALIWVSQNITSQISESITNLTSFAQIRYFSMELPSMLVTSQRRLNMSHKLCWGSPGVLVHAVMKTLSFSWTVIQTSLNGNSPGRGISTQCMRSGRLSSPQSW